MRFGVDRAERPHDVVLSVHGELDIATVLDLRRVVDDMLTSLSADGAPRRVYVDLTSTAFIDSTGCRELARAAKTAAPLGVAVEVVAPAANRKVRRIVDFMQFGDLLPLHEQVPAA
jgi:anti-sigma B factor antagonist